LDGVGGVLLGGGGSGAAAAGEGTGEFLLLRGGVEVVRDGAEVDDGGDGGEVDVF
jgi:hypothetical protein